MSSAFLLLVYPLALILGGMLLGWLARWYRYGGRCGPKGLASGVPNVDAERGTVALDGTEPVKTAGTRRARVADDTRAALGSLKAGYADGKRPDAPGTPADPSPAARVGALAGNAAAAASSVGAGVAEATASASTSLRETGSGAAATVSDAASGAVDSTKSGLASMRDGYAEGKVRGDTSGDVAGDVPGVTPVAPGHGSGAARIGAVVGGAVASVKGAAASAAQSAKTAVEPLRDGTARERVTEATGNATRAVKDTASGAADRTKASLASMREGYAGGKTDDAPVAGAPVAGAPAVDASVDGSIDNATVKTSDDAGQDRMPLRDRMPGEEPAETTDGTARSVTDTAAPGETSDAPADGSVVSKVGAVVGDAVASVKGAAASAAESAKSAVEPLRDGTAKNKVAEVTGNAAQAVKDTASGATESTKSSLAAMREGYAEGKAPGDTPDAPADGSVVAKVGAAVGGAVASVKGAATSAAESAKSAVEPLRDGTVKDKVADAAQNTGDTVKGTASGAVDGTKSSLAAMREGYAEGKAPGDTPDAPADGSVLARVGAVVGGAVAGTAGAVSGAVETAKAATTRSDAPVESDSVGEAARGAARHDRGLPGATIGQEDGHVPTAEVPSPRVAGGADDDGSAASRTRFASLSEDSGPDGTTRGNASPALDSIEEEARRLIDSGEEIAKPGNTLAAPAPGRAPDDLKRISGVGPRIERTLNDEGIYYFDQVADFTAPDLAWADRTLGFHGRVVRDRWMPQARALAAERVPEKPASKNDAAETVGHRTEPGASGDAPVNLPLNPSEIEAMRLIEREGGYAATAQNRPEMLMRDGPVGGKPDDLKRIKGIGKKLEKVLNGLGVYYFRQIAAFSAADMAWVDSKLKFKGRIVRDRWVPQADLFERNRDT